MKQLQVKASVVLVSIIIGLVLIELTLMLLGIEYPHFFYPDPHVQMKFRPGIKGYWLKEGGGYVSINSDGLRDREHNIRKPPNTLRIAILGDSFAAAMEVNQEEAFWAIMENELQSCINLQGRNIEVINFGIPGLSTTQELLVLRHRVWKYSPDVVLLAFFTNNDVAENSKDLAKYWPGDDYAPYYGYQNGKLVLDDKLTKEEYGKLTPKEDWPWWFSFSVWLKDNSRTFQLFRQFHKVLWVWWFQTHERGVSAATKPGLESNPQIDIYREPTDRVWKDAWRVTEGVMLMMRDEISAKGSRFFVVVVSAPAQVYPDPETRKKFTKKLGVPNLFYPDRRLEKFCQKEGIPVLLLAPAFQEYATAHKVFLHGFQGNLSTGHWNQSGHRLAGNMIARWLCGQLP